MCERVKRTNAGIFNGKRWGVDEILIEKARALAGPSGWDEKPPKQIAAIIINGIPILTLAGVKEGRVLETKTFLHLPRDRKVSLPIVVEKDDNGEFKFSLHPSMLEH